MRLVAYVAEISLQLLIYILVNVDLLVNIYRHIGRLSFLLLQGKNVDTSLSN